MHSTSDDSADQPPCPSLSSKFEGVRNTLKHVVSETKVAAKMDKDWKLFFTTAGKVLDGGSDGSNSPVPRSTGPVPEPPEPIPGSS